MAHRKTLIASLIGAAALLNGCAVYHNSINYFGPDKPVSPLRAQIEAPVILTEGSSPFCAKPVTETYMVMPEDHGVGIVDITFTDGRQATLIGEYQGMRIVGDGHEAFEGDDTQMNAMFGDALKALPAAPYYARLYFILDKDILTPESLAESELIYQQILGRQNVEIIIVGHTDTAASSSYNNALSLRRAEKVKQNLINAGVPAEIIQTQGMGETNLLVPTADNTPEPENRRVEISVR